MSTKIRHNVNDRAGIIGCSDIGALMNLSPYRTEYDVYKSFIGEKEEVSEEKQQIFDMGHRLEDLVGECLKASPWNLKIRRDNMAHPHPLFPQFICHPDRIVSGLVNGKRIGIEIKSSSVYDKSWGEPLTSEVPYGYLLQCLGYISCGVCDEVWLFRFANNKITKYIIERNDEIIDIMVHHIIDWIDKVKLGYVPEATTASGFVHEDIPTEGTMVLEDKLKPTVMRWKELKRESKVIETELKNLSSVIQQEMKDKKYILDSCGNKVIEQRYSERTDFDKKRFESEHPEQYKEYLKTTPVVSLYNTKTEVS